MDSQTNHSGLGIHHRFVLAVLLQIAQIRINNETLSKKFNHMAFPKYILIKCEAEKVFDLVAI